MMDDDDVYSSLSLVRKVINIIFLFIKSNTDAKILPCRRLPLNSQPFLTRHTNHGYFLTRTST